MRRKPVAAFPVLGLLLAAYLAAPLAVGIASVATSDWRGADWGGIRDATVVSVASASLATALVALGGVPLGFLLARRRGVFWRALGIVAQLPLALPPLASGILLLLLLGPDSRLTDTLGGIVLAQTFVAAPFGIIASRSAFAAVDPSLEDVASTLGHRPASVFRRVSLPLAARPIAAGLLLAWLRAFGEFGATVLVAYHPMSLPVFTYVAFGSEGLPAVLPVLVPTLLAAVAATLGAGLVARWPTVAAPGSRTALRHAAPISPAPPRTSGASRRYDPPRPAAPLRLRTHVVAGTFTLDLDWRPEARRLAILGASGSGKSLTLRVLAGLAPDGRTSFRLGALDLSDAPPERRPIGWVPQHYGLIPGLAVARQIRFAADADEAEASHWSTRLGLAALAGRLPETLSGGERQRVALARAMARRGTSLLLLDEPFAALDATLRSRLRAETRRFADEIDAAVVLVTHDPDEAMEFADELLLLEGGRAIQSGSVETLFRRPVSVAAARLLGAAATGTGIVDGASLIRIGGDVALDAGSLALPPAGATVGWAIRADQVRLVAHGHRATIVGRDDAARGGRHALLLRLGDATLPALADPSAVPAGDSVFVSIDPAAVQVWPEPATPREIGAADRARPVLRY